MISQPKRVAAYCRTSGEGQRHNTSIPNQKDKIQKFCEQQGWTIVAWYVDECISGSKIDGREQFQLMIKDAMEGKFDVVVPYAIDRFGRDEVDSKTTAKFLKFELGIPTVESQGKYDNRDYRKGLGNSVHQAVAEYERLTILERTHNGRMRKAMEGKPWTREGRWPIGRSWDATEQRWYVNDTGKMILELLERFVAGEAMKDLCRQYGIKNQTKISKWVHHGQLCGQYRAHFVAEELDRDEYVDVPNMPEVVPQNLLDKVKARLAHNRTFNRKDAAPRYRLSGFVRCARCGCALTGTIGKYRHPKKGCKNDGMTLGGGKFEATVLDHLYGSFLDQPAFEKAVERRIPSDKDRQRCETSLDKLTASRQRCESKLDKLVDAVLAGTLHQKVVERKQTELMAEIEKIDRDIEQLKQRLEHMPARKDLMRRARSARGVLRRLYSKQDWRTLDVGGIHTFLHYLIGDGRGDDGNGILVDRGEANWRITFRGRLDTLADEALEMDRKVKPLPVNRSREKGPTYILWSDELEMARKAA
jgi:DNA invertase Pin-like site-specific DNA recombinase